MNAVIPPMNSNSKILESIIAFSIVLAIVISPMAYLPIFEVSNKQTEEPSSAHLMDLLEELLEETDTVEYQRTFSRMADPNDHDGDGLSNALELSLGLDANSSDSDFDGILDSVEYYSSGIADLDGDSLISARDADSDGDMLPDYLDLSPQSVVVASANSAFDFSRSPLTVGRPGADSYVSAKFQVGSTPQVYSDLIRTTEDMPIHNITEKVYLKFLSIGDWDNSQAKIHSMGFMPPIGTYEHFTSRETIGARQRVEFASYVPLHSYSSSFGYAGEASWGDMRYYTYDLSLPSGAQVVNNLTSTTSSGVVLLTDAPLYTDSVGLVKPDLRQIPEILDYIPIQGGVPFTLTGDPVTSSTFNLKIQSGDYSTQFNGLSNQIPLYLHVFGFSLGGEPEVSETSTVLAPSFTMVHALVDDNGHILREIAPPYALLGFSVKNIHDIIQGYVPYNTFAQDLSEAQEGRIHGAQTSLGDIIANNEDRADSDDLFGYYSELLSFFEENSDLVGFPGSTAQYNGSTMTVEDLLATSFSELPDTMTNWFGWTENIKEQDQMVYYSTVRKTSFSSINMDDVFPYVAGAWNYLPVDHLPVRYQAVTKNPVPYGAFKFATQGDVQFDYVSGKQLRRYLNNENFFDVASDYEDMELVYNILASDEFPYYQRILSFSEPDLAPVKLVNTFNTTGYDQPGLAKYYSLLYEHKYPYTDGTFQQMEWMNQLVNISTDQGLWKLNTTGPNLSTAQKEQFLKVSVVPLPSPGGNDFWGVKPPFYQEENKSRYNVILTNPQLLYWTDSIMTSMVRSIRATSVFTQNWNNQFIGDSGISGGWNGVDGSLGDNFGNPGGIGGITDVGGGFNNIGDAISSPGSGWGDLVDGFRNAMGNLKNSLGMLDGVRDFMGIGKFFDGFGIADNAMNLWDDFNKFASGDWDGWDIAKTVQDALGLASDIASATGREFGGLLGKALKAWAAWDLGTKIGDWIAGRDGRGGLGWFKDAFGLAKLAWQEGFGHAWDAYKQALADQFSDMGKLWSDRWNKWWDGLDSIGDWLKDLLGLGGPKQGVAGENPDDSIFPVENTQLLGRPVFRGLDPKLTMYYFTNLLMGTSALPSPDPEFLDIPAKPNVKEDNLNTLLWAYGYNKNGEMEELNLEMMLTTLSLLMTIAQAPRAISSRLSTILPTSFPVVMGMEEELSGLTHLINQYCTVGSTITWKPIDEVEDAPPHLVVFEHVPVRSDYSVTFNKELAFRQFLGLEYPDIYDAVQSGALTLTTAGKEVGKRLSTASNAYQIFSTEGVISGFDHFIIGYWVDKATEYKQASREFQLDIVRNADIAVLAEGYAKEMFSLLMDEMLLVPRMVDATFDPAQLYEMQQVLVIPSGALGAFEGEQQTALRTKLSQYADLGGRIILFPQATSSDYQAVPGFLPPYVAFSEGDPFFTQYSLQGSYAWGYNEYIGCLAQSTTINLPNHPIAAAFDRSIIDLGVDGALVHWPSYAVPVMTRTTAERQAGVLVTFNHSKGEIIFSGAYVDFRHGAFSINSDERTYLDALFGYAYGVNWYEVGGVDYEDIPVYDPGQNTTLPITLDNMEPRPVAFVELQFLGPNSHPIGIHYQNVSLPEKGDSVSIDLPFEVIEDALPGMYTTRAVYHYSDGSTRTDYKNGLFAIKTARPEIRSQTVDYSASTKELEVHLTVNSDEWFFSKIFVELPSVDEFRDFYIELNEGLNTFTLNLTDIDLPPGPHPLLLFIYDYQSIKFQSRSTIVVSGSKASIEARATPTSGGVGDEVNISMVVVNPDTTYNLSSGKIELSMVTPSGKTTAVTSFDIVVLPSSTVTRSYVWTVPSDALSGTYRFRAVLLDNSKAIVSDSVSVSVTGASAVIESVTLSKSSFTISENISMTIDVFSGSAAIELAFLEVVLLDDDNIVVSSSTTDDMTLQAFEGKVVSFTTFPPLGTGNYSFNVSLKVEDVGFKTVHFMCSPEFTVTEILAITQFGRANNTGEVVVGYYESYSVTVENLASATQTLFVKVNSTSTNDGSANTTVSVTGGSTRTVTLDLKLVGIRSKIWVYVTSEGVEKTYTSSIDINPKLPVEFVSVNQITADPVDANTQVTYDVTVKNWILQANQANLTVFLEGVKVDSQLISLASNQSKTISVSVSSGETPGTKLVEFELFDVPTGISDDSQGDSFIVETETPSTPAYIAGFTLANASAVVLAGVPLSYNVTITNQDLVQTDYILDVGYLDPSDNETMMFTDFQMVSIPSETSTILTMNLTLPEVGYYYKIWARVTPDPAGDEHNLTQITAKALCPIVLHSFEPINPPITAGELEDYRVTVWNRAQVSLTVDITVDYLQAGDLLLNYLGISAMNELSSDTNTTITLSDLSDFMMDAGVTDFYVNGSFNNYGFQITTTIIEEFTVASALLLDLSEKTSTKTTILSVAEDDVRISAVSFDKESYNPGEVVEVILFVDNSGSSSVTFTLVYDHPSLYYYTLADIALESGESDTLTLTYEIPSGVQGGTYPGAVYLLTEDGILDSTTYSTEIQSYETSLSLTFDASSYGSGDSVVLTFNITNTGALDITRGSLTVLMTVPGMSNTLGEELLVNLTVGQSKLIEVTFELAEGLRSGQAVVSYNLIVKELALLIGHDYVAIQGDESLSAIVLLDKSHLESGQDLSGTIQIRNVDYGSLTTNISLTVTELQRSFQQSMTDVLNGTTNVGFTIDLADDTPNGIYSAYLTVRESNSSQVLLTRVIQFTVTGPHIVQTTFSVGDTTPASGDQLTVDVTLKNLGTVATEGILLVELLDESGTSLYETNSSLDIDSETSEDVTSLISLPENLYSGYYYVRYTYQSNLGTKLLVSSRQIYASGVERTPQTTMEFSVTNETLLGITLTAMTQILNTGDYSAEDLYASLYDNTTGTPSLVANQSVSLIGPGEYNYVRTTFSVDKTQTNLTMVLYWKGTALNVGYGVIYAEDAPPVIGSIYTGSEDNYATLPVTVRASITDNMEVESATLYYRFSNDTDWVTLALNSGGANIWQTVVQTAITDQVLYLFINASDNNGLESTSDVQRFDLMTDGQAPEIVSVESSTDDPIITGSFTLTITTADEKSGVYSLVVGLGSENITSQTFGTSPPSRRITVTVDTTSAEDGVQELTIWVKDLVGNLNSTVFPIDVDNKAPLITPIEDFTFGLEDSNDSKVLTWTVVEVHPENYTLTSDNTSLANGSWGGEAISYSLVGYEVGEYTFNLTVMDELGRASTTSVTVTVVEGTTTDDTWLYIAAGVVAVFVVLLGIGSFVRSKFKKGKK